MSVSIPVAPLVRRALTDDEFTALVARIDAAGSAGELLTVAITGVFDILLADLGQTFADYQPDQRLDPARFAIPRCQWQALAGAVTRRADAWGAGAHIAMQLVNVFPSSYDDPQARTPTVAATDHRPDEFVLRISRSAADEIAACEAHLDDLSGYYGADSGEYLQAQHSWHRCLATLFSGGNGPSTVVSRDSRLSLYVVAGPLHFGLIFHGQRRTCTTAACGAVAGDDGRWSPRRQDAVVLDHAHEPSYPLGAPQPGQWSMHS